ncbi:hypothetical protein HYPSUDRAFT_210130 [Hypholoma sublateritium FD-334 SS-4]|uniref:Uncharacterized protein n=1 Tax=Hypholoma sublateritium (strain FD-334 SS-4) TaxID=945553 RepID=A0A0D2N0S0_HYPSF|nr:hypothetical protein HYPSUDRAFT_210130 [Hypholoma sublateritium FD-334 SS-4]
MYAYDYPIHFVDSGDSAHPTTPLGWSGGDVFMHAEEVQDLHRLLVVKLQQTVKEQQRRIDGLAAALKSFKSGGSESSDSCVCRSYADDDDSSDVGSMTPGTSTTHTTKAGIDRLDSGWLTLNSDANSTTFFPKLSPIGEPTIVSSPPTPGSSGTSVKSSTMPSSRATANVPPGLAAAPAIQPQNRVRPSPVSTTLVRNKLTPRLIARTHWLAA